MAAKFTVKNPATGAVVGEYVQQHAEEVAKAVAGARHAQTAWATLSYNERAKHVLKMKAFLAANADRACEVITACSGKVRQDSLVTEVISGVLACDWYAKNTKKVLASQKLPTGSTFFANKSNELIYEPVGVVGIISPWNYPFSIPFGEVLMGLMAGNAVLLKVATNSTPVGCFIDDVVKAGELPPGLFQHLIVGGAEAGPAFLAAGINKLFFTGSVGVGKKLMAEAAKTLTPLSLELGGNDPMVVLKDAAIERAVNCACWAGYQNAGQSCGGVERIYVDESIYPEFLEQLKAKTAALRHGPDSPNFDVDMGCVTTKGQYDTIDAQVKEAVAQGAKIEAQSRPVPGCPTDGLFYPATVLSGCTPSMRVMREETFGPILPVVPFKTEAEAIQLANDCNLALTSSVFSRDAKHAKAVAMQLQSGVVSINDHLYSHGMAEAPWGGWKESGLGRTHGYLGLKEMCNVKCINTDAVPSAWMPRNLWWYPFSADTYKLLRRALVFAAPNSCGSWLSSVWYVVTHSGSMFRAWKVKDKNA
ncbi:putative mitochondrial aldehyde dehydrogenase [Leptomonas pyrrhocoris]|uniref:Putative mitochondrial aldehyde dehydrogenase n=1 Tax=Leptomonas pyrrhocoris TaxID=157538 RepID=A0A0M9G3U4_LEPPY|nr:putative mitochondrial aldehyde dehydrogenase [Leptomonas pyrrhocoris]KPA81599.1 putative mitochondrial aldehyde dehydrogenase [Leptomonas pyrrhocoris]|eukprot:XP_015660038.1 putative mitochondrial aldehyde dehydrogenase [Leptomonas pyrrhocoris]